MSPAYDFTDDALSLEDINSDGTLDVVYGLASSESGYSEGKLNPDSDIDYMILDGTPKYGAFEFSDRQLGKFTYSPSGQVAIKDNSISEKAILSISVENNAPVVESLVFETHWNSSLS